MVAKNLAGKRSHLLVTVEICPLRNEEFLPTIIDTVNRRCNTEAAIQAFQSRLPKDRDTQLAFAHLDDLMAVATAEIQRETVAALHCPFCSNYQVHYPSK
jgi:hypothetical protein